MSSSTKSERIYSLDALRAIMMLLGIVLHAGITYGKIDYQTAWPLKDTSTNLVFDLLIALIHSFRMPVFFVTAGYFGALLFYKKGPWRMITNRINRIVFPFIAAVIIIYPLVVLAFSFSALAISGEPNPLAKGIQGILAGNFLPYKVAHLWFLYFLVIFSFASWLIALIFNKSTRFTNIVNSAFRYVIRTFWLRVLTMSLIFFACYYILDTYFLFTNTTFKIEPVTLITYFLFYETGWMLYKADSLKQLSSYPLLQLSIAILLFFVLNLTKWSEDVTSLHIKQLINAASGSFFIFGFLALFIKYFSSYSRRLRYLMDASYYVYIIHLPIVAFVPGLLAPYALAASVKFTIVFVVTCVTCFTSYHYTVRRTIIGKFLNGRIYKRENSLEENGFSTQPEPQPLLVQPIIK
jgi:glucan biosynthesis protein C